MRKFILAIFMVVPLLGCATNLAKDGGMHDDYENDISNAGSSFIGQ
jgi:hypothetical protein